MLIKNRYLKAPLDVCEDVSESRPVIKSDPNRPVIDRISGIPLQFKERVTTKKRRKKRNNSHITFYEQIKKSWTRGDPFQSLQVETKMTASRSRNCSECSCKEKFDDLAPYGIG